jgi:hypothetical protein
VTPSTNAALFVLVSSLQSPATPRQPWGPDYRRRAKGHGHLKMSEPAAHERIQVTPLRRTQGYLLGSSQPALWVGLAFQQGHRSLSLPLRMRSRALTPSHRLGSHLPRMSMNFLLWSWVYSGTSLLHGIHLLDLDSKWKSYKVGSWPAERHGGIYFTDAGTQGRCWQYLN